MLRYQGELFNMLCYVIEPPYSSVCSIEILDLCVCTTRQPKASWCKSIFNLSLSAPRSEHEEAEVAADAVLPLLLRAGDVRRARRRLPGQPRAAQRHRGIRALPPQHQRRHQARAAGTKNRSDFRADVDDFIRFRIHDGFIGFLGLLS